MAGYTRDTAGVSTGERLKKAFFSSRLSVLAAGEASGTTGKPCVWFVVRWQQVAFYILMP